MFNTKNANAFSITQLTVY